MGNTVRQNSVKAWLLASRPKTLTGAAVPVMIGLSWAWADGAAYFQWVPAVLCLLFAFLMQIDANFVNDLFDFARGTDDASRLGPKRACAEGWVTMFAMRHAIALTTVVACLAGLPLVFWGGLEMIAVGILCVLFCFLYTTHLSYVGMGDVLVLVFFGIVPVCATYYIQLHTLTWMVFLSSLFCGMVIDTLLLVNNFRDRDTDREKGKNTLVVKVGEGYSLLLYLLCGLVPVAGGVLFLFEGHPLAFVLPLLYGLLHYFCFIELKTISRGRGLNMVLGKNARNMFLYGLLLSAGLLL